MKMEDGKIYTVDDFFDNVVQYGKTIGLLVQFPSIVIPTVERPKAYLMRAEDKKFLRDNYKDLKWYIQNDIFSAGNVLDILHRVATDTLPDVDDADYSRGYSREEVAEHLSLLTEQIDIVIMMILTNILTDEDYPAKRVEKFIELEK